jgi:hypothetical protein
MTKFVGGNNEENLLIDDKYDRLQNHSQRAHLRERHHPLSPFLFLPQSGESDEFTAPRVAT